MPEATEIINFGMRGKTCGNLNRTQLVPQSTGQGIARDDDIIRIILRINHAKSTWREQMHPMLQQQQGKRRLL
jgi:hypothetical protein